MAQMDYWPLDGGPKHAALLCLDRGVLWQYEPQYVRVQLTPVQDAVRQAVEIWG